MWWSDPSPPQSRTSADWWQTSLWADWQWTPLDCRVSSLDRKSYTQSLPMPEKSLLDGPLAKPAGKKKEHFNSINLNQLIKASTNQYIHRSILLNRFDINITMKTITKRRPVEHIGVCFIDFLMCKHWYRILPRVTWLQIALLLKQLLNYSRWQQIWAIMHLGWVLITSREWILIHLLLAECDLRVLLLSLLVNLEKSFSNPQEKVFLHNKHIDKCAYLWFCCFRELKLLCSSNGADH